MTTCLGKSCSFCLPRVPFVNCRQFMYLVIFPFWFWGQDMGSVCISSWSLLIFLLHLVCRTIRSKKDPTLLQEDLTNYRNGSMAGWCNSILTNVRSSGLPRKEPLTLDYYIHSTRLQTVKDARYLGVTITSDLSWNRRVNNIAKKATTSLSSLKRNLYSCPSFVSKLSVTNHRYDQ